MYCTQPTSNEFSDMVQYSVECSCQEPAPYRTTVIAEIYSRVYVNPPNPIKGKLHATTELHSPAILSTAINVSLHCHSGCEPPSASAVCCRGCLPTISWTPRQGRQRWEGRHTRCSRTSRTSRDLGDIIHSIPRAKGEADK